MKFKNFLIRKNLYFLVIVVFMLGTLLIGCAQNQTIAEKQEKAEIQNTLDGLCCQYGIFIAGEKNFPDFPRWIRAIEKSISILPPPTQDIILKKSPSAHRALIIEFIKDQQIN